MILKAAASGGPCAGPWTHLELITLALPRGLNLAAGWLIFLGSFGFCPYSPAIIAALVFMLASRQIESGNALRTAPFTFMFVTAIVTTFSIAWLFRGDEGAQRFAAAGSLSWPQLLRGELWRIPATVLLHRDWDHLTSNVTWLLGVGLLLEPAIGSWVLARACLFTLGTSTVAMLALQKGGYGASGVAYGLHGVLLTRPFRMRRDGRRAISWTWVLAAWLLLIDLPESQYSKDIGFAAHIGGLVGGVVFGCLWLRNGSDRVARRLSPRRVFSCAAIVLGLLGAVAINPRWPIDWNSDVARDAETAGDLASADRHWRMVESVADPGEPLDARKLHYAAQYWARRGDVGHSRLIMSAICPTLGADEYIAYGRIQAFRDPPDERGALNSWEQALTLDPTTPEVLQLMAYTRLYPSDSSLYSATAARLYAQCAVEQDGYQSPIYLHTLAVAQYYCGNEEQAIQVMQRAIARDPAKRAEYEADMAEMQRDTLPTEGPGDTVAVAGSN